MSRCWGSPGPDGQLVSRHQWASGSGRDTGSNTKAENAWGRNLCLWPTHTHSLTHSHILVTHDNSSPHTYQHAYVHLFTHQNWSTHTHTTCVCGVCTQSYLVTRLPPHTYTHMRIHMHTSNQVRSLLLVPEGVWTPQCLYLQCLGLDPLVLVPWEAKLFTLCILLVLRGLCSERTVIRTSILLILKLQDVSQWMMHAYAFVKANFH